MAQRALRASFIRAVPKVNNAHDACMPYRHSPTSSVLLATLHAWYPKGQPHMHRSKHKKARIGPRLVGLLYKLHYSLHSILIVADIIWIGGSTKFLIILMCHVLKLHLDHFFFFFLHLDHYSPTISSMEYLSCLLCRKENKVMYYHKSWLVTCPNSIILYIWSIALLKVVAAMK